MKPIKHEIYVECIDEIKDPRIHLLMWRFRNPRYVSIYGATIDEKLVVGEW